MTLSWYSVTPYSAGDFSTDYSMKKGEDRGDCKAGPDQPGDQGEHKQS